MLQRKFYERVLFTAHAFIMDETGNGTSEYALIASTIALAMLAVMALVQTAAAGQLTFTDTNLDNRNGVTP